MKIIDNIDFTKIVLNNGFWKERYNLNKEVSINSIYQRFEETGRIDALRFNYKRRGIYPHIFFDSDVAKWIEAVAYLIEKEPKGFKKEQKIIDALVNEMEKNQLENGYLNSHFIQIEKENIFKRRGDHELYCAGHLLEAAIAYHKATKKEKLLNVMLKYVDCIEKVFIKDKTSAFTTCGHEEIELALLRLYDYTQNQKYLDMASFFINKRGVKKEVSVVEDFFNNKYDQSEIPVRDLKKAEGHAVRAMYLYIAMSELALKTKDQKLYDACERLFDDIVSSKMYITGGIGSSKHGEAFTISYDLPNLEAYSESCATIGLLLFCLSMQQFGKNAKYGDVIERIMYNNLLSSTSLDGRGFFYENPLEIHLASVDKDTCIIPSKRNKLPLRHRLEVFDCSCCPPNIGRVIAKIGDVFLSKTIDELIVNQFTSIEYKDEKIVFKMESDYPNSGKVKISISNNSYRKLSIRIPSWCVNFSLNGSEYIENNQYIEIAMTSDSLELTIDFKMRPYFVESNPLVRTNNGKVALCYGPMVYCIEELDNDYELNACCVSVNKKIKRIINESYSSYDFIAQGIVDKNFDSLYRLIDKKTDNIQLYFKPYYTFANREECDMLIWIRRI